MRYTILFEKRDEKPWVLYDRKARKKTARFKDRKDAERAAKTMNATTNDEFNEDVRGTFFG